MIDSQVRILTYLLCAVKHVNSHLLLILAFLQRRCHSEPGLRTFSSVFIGFQGPVGSAGLIFLQEDGGPAGVPLNLHPEDPIPRPAVPDRLQTVDGGAGEGDVDVGQDEEDEERLKERAGVV